MDSKVIIEVGLNEGVTKAQNANVAYGVDEVVADAVACAAAGAAVIHFHARENDGTQRWADAAIYREAMEGIARECDVIAYPSYLGDHSHIWDLLDAPPLGAPLAIASFDVPQEVPTPVSWDESAQQFVPLGFDDVGDRSRVEPRLLAEFDRRGVRPTVAAFDVGHVRYAVLAARAGFLRPPIDLKVFLCGTILTGPFPTPAAIDAYLSQIPDDLEVECTVVPYTMGDAHQVEVLLRAALERGVHVRVGIGDNPAAFPTATNAELVAHVVALADEYGRVPATPADVRKRFSLSVPG